MQKSAKLAIFGWSTIFSLGCFVMYIFLLTIWWSFVLFRKNAQMLQLPAQLQCWTVELMRGQTTATEPRLGFHRDCSYTYFCHGFLRDRSSFCVGRVYVSFVGLDSPPFILLQFLPLYTSKPLSAVNSVKGSLVVLSFLANASDNFK